MSLTLSKGYKLPQTGDRAFWTDLEFDIQRLNDHDHDGTDSALINPSNLEKQVQTLLAASWSAVAGQTGTYKQTLTCPTGYTVALMQVKFYVNGGGEDGYELFPTVRKVTATTFDVFINDNSVELKAVYG